MATNTPLFFRPTEISPELNQWLGFPTGMLAQRKMDPPIGLRIPDPWPEELTLFKDGTFGSPARGLIQRHAVFPVQEDLLQPILSLENGETVWGRSTLEPNVFYWNIPLGKDESDLVAQPQWVPMFGEGLRYAFRHSESLSGDAGDVFALALSAFADADFILRNEQGEPLPSQRAEGVLSSTTPLGPGIYQWSTADDQHIQARRAINLPVEESNLTPLEPESTTGSPLPELASADDWKALQEGVPLWPWLLAMAFLIAAAEQILTQKEART